MRVLLDTNVVLDSMLQRQPWNADADAILQAAAQGRLTCAVTPISLVNVFYVGRKFVGKIQARTDVRLFFQAFDILPLDKQTLLDADALAGMDFEDDMQIAAGMSAAVDAIVTRNASDFSHSPLPVWTPSELLQRLRTGITP